MNCNLNFKIGFIVLISNMNFANKIIHLINNEKIDAEEVIWYP